MGRVAGSRASLQRGSFLPGYPGAGLWRIGVGWDGPSRPGRRGSWYGPGAGRCCTPIPGADTLAPSPRSQSLSVVLELRFGQFRALLTGECPPGGSRMSLTNPGDDSGAAFSLEGGWGHHGSRTSHRPSRALAPEATPSPLGEAVNPRGGGGNSFGHPPPPGAGAPGTGRWGFPASATDRQGDVVVRARRGW